MVRTRDYVYQPFLKLKLIKHWNKILTKELKSIR